MAVYFRNREGQERPIPIGQPEDYGSKQSDKHPAAPGVSIGVLINLDSRSHGSSLYALSVETPSSAVSRCPLALQPARARPGLQQGLSRGDK